MLKVIKDWADSYLSDPEAILLLFILVFGFAIIATMGNILLPVLISIVVAYLLQWWVVLFERYGVPHKLAYISTYFMFLSVFIISFVYLFPLIWRQCTNLFNELPTMVQKTKQTLFEVVRSNESFITEQHIETLTSGFANDAQIWAKKALSISLSSIPGVITWLVYLVLVPLLVFFFLKDHKKMINWAKAFLPKRHALLKRIWREMDEQIGNYIRGKITEILIVTVFTYLVFWYFKMPYQILLAVLVGLSVVIPYVGAVVVTIPVALVGYLEWGLTGGITGDFALMILSYSIVQFIDGNIIVPLLFSEAVNLHPVAIIISILLFGSIWGFWGVFFAIPLATLIKAVINSWPKTALVDAG